MSDEPEGRSFPYRTDSGGPPATGIWGERRRLASAMRTVIEHLMVSDAPEDEIHAAADALERYAARLAGHPQRRTQLGFTEASTAGDVRAFFDFSPLIGLSNPISPPLELAVDGETVRGRVRFGTAYEGPPGCVHGGCIAAIFDELLGFTQSLTHHPGMTGTLTIRYRTPTPLHVDLRCEARVRGVERRKIFCEGRLFSGDTLCAEADGIFISVG